MRTAPVLSLIDDQLAAIDAARAVDRIAFSASSILGAKSLAYQQGIDPRRPPAFQAWVGGMWTLVYECAQ